MPIYDIRCSHCDGIFEKLLSIKALDGDIACTYCQQPTPAKPMLTGGHALKSTQRWTPRNGAEQLAGMGAGGPGAHAGSARSSVLHNCKGFNCSVCDT
ncbi:zinc ribbon domain-containing protein [Herbaspirillum sp. RTI4]|uniref:FmdB family zinc ribbon protein n=1 Tax=Herbaspirillum sp. RTI4 TaxID=3048640 RepID=UPI002AB5AB9E|nr:FmdB family zinc ribbon protein [Herbaspirillum sp. RTI4]MDY7579186.1 zinc ribbon domain-containing protein [Herbaspirillum sp. RTI4]MEA9983234.1 zinc ribbon domain-containing protein [Herbaspirillum sp. RTI4]